MNPASILASISFSDIFKSSFLENFNSVSYFDMAVALLLSFGVGVFIFMIYRKTFKGVMYSSTFGVTLIALTMISTFVILAVTSNVVLSLGMVGALSIVRFRTAIKEPLDIAFLFWSIAAGMIPLAVIGSGVIGLMLVVFVNKKAHTDPYIVVISCADAESEKRAGEYLAAHADRCVVKSKSVKAGRVELKMEIRLKSGDTAFINELSALNGVNSAVLVSYNGEYMG